MPKRIRGEYIGPQCASDNNFTKKARWQQSFYRLDKLEEIEFGIGPNHNSKDKLGNPTRYGNMLVNGETTGKNFILESTFKYAKERISQKKQQTIDSYRLFNNMLSSMPLCFNLFHPLIEILKTHPGHVKNIFLNIFPNLPICQIESIDVEVLPLPIKDYLNDKTAFDALISFRDGDDEKYLIAFEVKYIDSLGNNKPANNKKHIEFAKQCGLFTDSGGVRIEEKCTQVFRNFLLSEKYKVVNGFKECFSVIVAPKQNPFSIKEIELLKGTLKEQYRFKANYLEMEKLISEINSHVPFQYRKWIETFQERYLDLSWSQFQQ